MCMRIFVRRILDLKLVKERIKMYGIGREAGGGGIGVLDVVRNLLYGGFWLGKLKDRSCSWRVGCYILYCEVIIDFGFGLNDDCIINKIFYLCVIVCF